MITEKKILEFFSTQESKIKNQIQIGFIIILYSDDVMWNPRLKIFIQKPQLKPLQYKKIEFFSITNSCSLNYILAGYKNYSLKLNV